MSKLMLVEKYRPSSLEDIILPKKIKDVINEWKTTNVIPSLLLSSVSAGLGKTSLAHVLAKEFNADILFINASLENGIDVLRTKITDFSSKRSIISGTKIVVLDEADNITQSAQAAFRGLLDSFAKNVTFIFTCNNRDKIITPLQSRLYKIDFDEVYAKNKKEMIAGIVKMTKNVLDCEGIKYDPKDVRVLITDLYPQTRDIIMRLQQNITDGVLTLGEGGVNKFEKYINLINYTVKGDWKSMKQSVNDTSYPEGFYTWFWKNIDNYIQPDNQIDVIMLLNKYDYQNSAAIDKELNLAAFLTEVMMKKIKWSVK